MANLQGKLRVYISVYICVYTCIYFKTVWQWVYKSFQVCLLIFGKIRWLTEMLKKQQFGNCSYLHDCFLRLYTTGLFLCLLLIHHLCICQQSPLFIAVQRRGRQTESSFTHCKAFGYMKLIYPDSLTSTVCFHSMKRGARSCCHGTMVDTDDTELLCK